ncbi:MAG: c-type cytochrome biogenesis protein CcsB [Actinobacteria bacterium]|nr:c-type cytochrome biogenesis protein CcsB [Actinomycetota bacterium]MBI3686875.1 c-type cytochrome biogenesis protein CcsB [Actinomycetota bacterium]
MLTLSHYSLVAGVALIALALASYMLVLTIGRSVHRRPAMARVGGGAAAEVAASRPRGLAQYGTAFTQLALAFLTASLVCRAIATGHGPFANQYEFAVAFGWGMVGAYVYVERRYHVRTLALLILPIATALLLYAMTVGATATPLVPALQNSLLLTVHVAVAILAYGAFSVACAAGALYLIQPEGGRRGMPKPALLDEIAYRAVVIAFPLMTMTIILGAVWADIAWGSYWSWDPKETASLLTWLIYGGYLHARVVRGWRGRRAAWLLMAGFAAVLFTFFGNLFFGGLHSYAGISPR